MSHFEDNSQHCLAPPWIRQGTKCPCHVLSLEKQTAGQKGGIAAWQETETKTKWKAAA